MGEWSCRKGDKACIVLIFFFAEGGRALRGEVCVFVGAGGACKNLSKEQKRRFSILHTSDL